MRLSSLMGSAIVATALVLGDLTFADCPPCKVRYTFGRRTMHTSQETRMTCGPTSMQMWLYDRWGICLAQDSIATIVTNRQGYQVAYCRTNSIDCLQRSYNCCGGSGTSINGFMWGMYDLTPPGTYFNCWYYSHGPDAVRDACWALEFWDAPVAFLCYHGGHWMDLRGFRSTGSVVRSWPYFYTCGVWVEDPIWNSQCYPGQGWPNKTYMTAEYFMDNVFNDISGYRYLITQDSTQGQRIYKYYGVECP